MKSQIKKNFFDLVIIFYEFVQSKPNMQSKIQKTMNSFQDFLKKKSEELPPKECIYQLWLEYARHRQIERKHQSSSFEEFVKGSHVNSGSDIRYLPKEIIEKIWIEYASTNFSEKEILEKKLMHVFVNKLEKKTFLQDGSIDENYFYDFIIDLEKFDVFKLTLSSYPPVSQLHLLMGLAKRGNLEFMKYVYQQPWIVDDEATACHVFMQAVSHNHINLANWLYDNKKVLAITQKTMFFTDINHKTTINALEWAKSKADIRFSMMSIENALKAQTSIDILNWLRDNISEDEEDEEFEYLIDYAKDVSSLEWVCANYEILANGSSDALDDALMSRNCDVINWLIKNTSLKFSENALIHCARHGDLKMIIWIVDVLGRVHIYPLNYSRIIMAAAQHGHLDVVKWLCFRFPNLSINSIVMTLDKAIDYGQEKVVLWIIKNYQICEGNEEISCKIMSKCIQKNIFQIIPENNLTPQIKKKTYFWEVYLNLCYFNLNNNDTSNLLKWLLETYTPQFEYTQEDLKNFIRLSFRLGNQQRVQEILSSTFIDRFPNFYTMVEELQKI